MPSLLGSFYLTLEITEHLVHLLEACKGIGKGANDLHHLSDLTLVDDTNEHIAIGIRIHTVHVDFGDSVLETREQLIGKLARLCCDDFKLVAVLIPLRPLSTIIFAIKRFRSVQITGVTFIP